MRGSDVFPGRDNASREWAQLFDREVTAFMNNAARNGRDFGASPMMPADYEPIRIRLTAQYATWLAARDGVEQNRWKDIPVLDILALQEKAICSPAT